MAWYVWVSYVVIVGMIWYALIALFRMRMRSIQSSIDKGGEHVVADIHNVDEGHSEMGVVASIRALKRQELKNALLSTLGVLVFTWGLFDVDGLDDRINIGFIIACVPSAIIAAVQYDIAKRKEQEFAPMVEREVKLIQ